MTRAIFAAFVILLAAVLFVNRSETIYGADSSGYANLARMLARGEVTAPLPPGGQPPLGFVPVGNGRMASHYPPGLSLHFIVARSPFLVSPIAAVLLVILTWFLGRRLHSETAGVFAGVLMGCCAVLPFQGVQPMSDVVAAMWSAATIAAALEAGERPRWALGCGFCFGMAVLVRPTSILLLAPLAVCLWSRSARSTDGATPATVGIRLLYFLAGGVPAALFLGWYNLAAFGSLVGSGYAAAGASRDFALAYFPPRAMHYLYWTAALFGPAAFAAFFTKRWLFAVWFAPFLAFYSCYVWYDEWWYTRFLLPCYPAVAVAAGIAFARWRTVGVVLAVLTVGWEVRQLARYSGLYVDEEQHAARVLVERTRSLPSASAILCKEYSGSLLYYTAHQPVRWDLGPVQTNPRYALLMEHEETPFRAKYGTRFQRVYATQQGSLFVRAAERDRAAPNP